MPKSRLSRIFLYFAASILVFLSIKLGFADAWMRGYQFIPLSSSSTPIAVETIGQPMPDPLVKHSPAPLSKRVTEYFISVTLDEKNGILKGEQKVTWKNIGKKSVSDMYLHLYPNAFSPGSTFLKESGGQLRGDKMKQGSYGNMKLTSLQTEEGETLLPRVHQLHPDDKNKTDETLVGFRLPNPVKPGKKIVLHMKFSVKLPDVFARMGKAGDFIMAGQWFPKIPVYETTGMRGHSFEGWNLHQYHGNSEFYSDFGIFSVHINVPQNFQVAGTGFMTEEPNLKGNRKIYKFYDEDVHDFAWAASPHFLCVEESFSSPGIPGVRIKLYLDPSQKQLQERYLHAVKSTLAKLGQWYGEYPYSTLSIVIPPKSAPGAAGMEYPTLITGAAAINPNPGYELERTLVHEIAHQYWYGLVASNEFEEAWLDEGFTSYTEDKLMSNIYGVKTNHSIEASFITHPQPLNLLAWKFTSHNGYAENVYLRGKLVLNSLERLVGEDEMNVIMRTYFERFKFKHPSVNDFQQIVEKVTKKNWDNFFQTYVQRGEMSDFSIDSIQTKVNKSNYETIVSLSRNGGYPEPVTIWLQFKDGKVAHHLWDNNNPHLQLKIESNSSLLFTAIDAKNEIALDNFRFNNYLKTQVPPKQKSRITTGVTNFLEALFRSFTW